MSSPGRPWTGRPFFLGLWVALATALALPAAAAGPDRQAREVDPGAVERLERDAGPGARVRARRGTSVAGFVRADSGRDLLPGSRAGSARAKANEFLRDHADLFGLSEPGDQLEVIGESSDALGTRRVRYRQVVDGIEVFGGELRAHFGPGLDLTSIGGSVVAVRGPLSTTPALPGPEADAIATAKSAAEAIGRRLVIYDTGLLRGIPGTAHLAWEVEIGNADLTVHEWVFVDAASGGILERISGVHETLHRRVGETSLGNIIWDEGLGHPDPITAGWASGTAAQVTAWNGANDGAKESYNLFGSMTNGAYLSYDGLDAIMYTVNNDPGISCPNATWNGVSTNYCDGVTGDDTVAHEWMHAYTEYTHNLIYAWQAGALNESYSDIFGEVVDFLNGRGTDSPLGLRASDGSACSTFGNGSPSTDATYRWLSGEDDPGFGGAIRDMWQPLCYGDPDKVSSGSYVCSSADNGGVHTNSGVPNHAFALLVDGGTYNGQTITGIGLEKAAHIYWRAATVYQVAASDFEDHANALEASCTDLLGAALYTPLTTGSGTWGGTLGSTISAADCTEVSDAIAAVELRTAPTQCSFTPMLDASPPALCGGSTVDTIHLQDWESGLGSWTVGTRSVANLGTFDTLDWAVVGSLPDSVAGSAAFVADDPALGNCQADTEAGVLFLQSPEIVIPSGVKKVRLAFDHWVSTEEGWDGANVKISVNGGGYTLVPASAYDFNPYNDTLNSSGQGNDNPLAGQEAFTGADGGSLTGSWGQSQVDLSDFADDGDTIQLRFEMGLDGCNGQIGWYVDDVHLFSCADEILCQETPATGCRLSQPFGSILTIIDGSKDKFVWKMNRGDATATADFLDPTQTGRNLSVCFYDDSGASQPIYEATIGSAGQCSGKDCWKSLNGKGFKYKNKTGQSSDGVTLMKFKEGDAGKTKVLAKGQGSFLTIPSLPLTTTVTTQLVIDDGVTQDCWQSTFPLSLVNDGSKFKSKGP
ncbi:MAG: M4 family metallopeptidase [Candidatus Binatia bacterium]|nr:M4 family metallopeptidase [Candidatus Binatia bacterium]